MDFPQRPIEPSGVGATASVPAGDPGTVVGDGTGRSSGGGFLSPEKGKSNEKRKKKLQPDHSTAAEVLADPALPPSQSGIVGADPISLPTEVGTTLRREIIPGLFEEEWTKFWMLSASNGSRLTDGRRLRQAEDLLAHMARRMRVTPQSDGTLTVQCEDRADLAVYRVIRADPNREIVTRVKKQAPNNSNPVVSSTGDPTASPEVQEDPAPQEQPGTPDNHGSAVYSTPGPSGNE